MKLVQHDDLMHYTVVMVQADLFVEMLMFYINKKEEINIRCYLFHFFFRIYCSYSTHNRSLLKNFRQILSFAFGLISTDRDARIISVHRTASCNSMKRSLYYIITTTKLLEQGN